MQLKAILFDLDDTLLENNMDRFLEGYFQLLSSYVQAYIDPVKFIDELLVGTQAMIQNDDCSLTNRDIFWDVFCRRTGLIRDEFEPLVDRFYRNDNFRDRQTSGTGLGLAIARSIIEAHNGTIAITSDGIGLGTTVCFELLMK